MDDFSKERIYGYKEAGEEVFLDPATLNLAELPMVLAMSGWMVAMGFNEDDRISLLLTDVGGGGSRSAEVLAEELGLRDDKGEIANGYSVTTNDFGKVELHYTGVPNMKLTDTVHRLWSMSPFNAEQPRPQRKSRLSRFLGGLSFPRRDR